MDLKLGLSLLAREPSPFVMSFQVPDFQFFIANLTGYKAKLQAYENFQKDNPDHLKRLAEAQAKDSRPYIHTQVLFRPYERMSGFEKGWGNAGRFRAAWACVSLLLYPQAAHL